MRTKDRMRGVFGAGAALGLLALPMLGHAQDQTAPAATSQSADPGAPVTPLPYDRGYDKDSPRTEAIDAGGRPDVEAANNAALAQTYRQGATQMSDQAQRIQDVATYQQALRARRHVINSDMRLYQRKQDAYAAAMAQWRRQTYACHHGSNRACEAPTPDPADYM